VHGRVRRGVRDHECRLALKGAASFFVPVAAWLQLQTGSWHAVFVAAAIANITVGALALFVVKPMRLSAQRAALTMGGVPATAK
jgi:OFA family oxalate/formate antiporter-like MFS transporter